MKRPTTTSQSLTMKELAGRLSKKFVADQAHVARVLQTWVTAQIIVPEGEIHQGPGNYRTFREEELFKAALIYELYSYALTIRHLHVARFLIDQQLENKRDILERAAGGEEWYFHFSLPIVSGKDPYVIKNAKESCAYFIQKRYNTKPWGHYATMKDKNGAVTALCFRSMLILRVDYILKGL